MLRRIARINDYRIFQGWRESAGSPDFSRVNVIYGINGSGKSSLSALLADAPEDRNWASGLKLRVSEAGSVDRTVDTPDDHFWTDVYVFNRDYVSLNLRFDIEGKSTTKPLLVLGKERIDQQVRIAQITERLEEIKELSAAAKAEEKKAERTATDLAKGAADLIVEELANSGLQKYEARRYNARQVKTTLQTAPAAGSLDIAADLTIATGPELRKLPSLGRTSFDLVAIETAVFGLLKQVAISEPIAALKDAPTLASWVQQGLALHQAGDECAFCSNKVTAEQIETLGRHFDDSLRDLQTQCDALLKRLGHVRAELKAAADVLPPVQVFDTSLGQRYTEASSVITEGRAELERRLTHLESLVQDKVKHLFTVVVPPAKLDGMKSLDLAPYVELISAHNALAEGSATRRAEAAGRIERSRIEDIRARFKLAGETVTESADQLKKLDEERTALEQEQLTLTQKDLDAAPLASSLSADLARLLGRDELVFELADEGYSIKRGTEYALYLSEGEKTAISLLYFLKSLEAHDCDRPNAIIVIDDPVSSLDSNVIAGVSAHLWARLVGGDKCRQLILFTHNFELFRMWTNQLDRLPEGVRTSQDITYTTQELRGRMVKRSDGKAVREPFFLSWPTKQSLRNRLRSEYHYLFWRAADALKRSQEDPTPETELDAVAILPNVCRRLLEGFLSFKYPEQIGDFRRLVETAIGDMDESVTRTRIVTYLHAYSHNEEGNISKPIARPESVRILGAVFELIRYVDKEHYDKMCGALSVELELLDA